MGDKKIIFNAEKEEIVLMLKALRSRAEERGWNKIEAKSNIWDSVLKRIAKEGVNARDFVSNIILYVDEWAINGKVLPIHFGEQKKEVSLSIDDCAVLIQSVLSFVSRRDGTEIPQILVEDLEEWLLEQEDEEIWVSPIKLVYALQYCLNNEENKEYTSYSLEQRKRLFQKATNIALYSSIALFQYLEKTMSSQNKPIFYAKRLENGEERLSFFVVSKGGTLLNITPLFSKKNNPYLQADCSPQKLVEDFCLDFFSRDFSGVLVSIDIATLIKYEGVVCSQAMLSAQKI